MQKGMKQLCRIVALKADRDFCMEPYFDFFRTMSERGINSPHGDGYGYVLRNLFEETLYRSEQSVVDAPNNDCTVRSVLLHSRKATGDYRRNLMQVHPFAVSMHGKTYYFVHNGVISRLEAREGVTDSQVYFERIVSMMVGGKNEAFALQSVANDLALKHEYTSLNAIFTDLNRFWVLKLNSDNADTYHDFWYTEHDGILIVSSEEPKKYMSIKEKSRRLDNGELFVF